MSSKVYIVKNLTPWMMDELKSFSNRTSFQLILLREPPDFYKDGLEYLEENSIEIQVRPFGWRGVFGRLRTVVSFVLSNIRCFDLGYNSVIGLKSCFWFLCLDHQILESDSSLHAQFATQPAVLALLVKRHFKNRPHIAFTFHAYDIYFNNRWFKLLVDESDKAFSISNFNLDYVGKKFVSSENLLLSRLGVFRSEIEIEEVTGANKKFVLGLMSWFVEKKGIIYLLRAIKELKRMGHEDIELLLAGDGPLFKELNQFVQENDLEGMIRFMGKIKGEDKNNFYNALNVFVLPSIQLEKDQDGIPVVLMEAIAYGLPLISTDVSGIPEICVQDFNGELIPEKAVERIVKAILKLKDDSDRIVQYSRNSMELSDQYDIEINSLKKMQHLNWI
jgi:glycosyltransferase involved in cell wall biosynthesis